MSKSKRPEPEIVKVIRETMGSKIGFYVPDPAQEPDLAEAMERGRQTRQDESREGRPTT